MVPGGASKVCTRSGFNPISTFESSGQSQGGRLRHCFFCCPDLKECPKACFVIDSINLIPFSLAEITRGFSGGKIWGHLFDIDTNQPTPTNRYDHELIRRG